MVYGEITSDDSYDLCREFIKGMIVSEVSVV